MDHHHSDNSSASHQRIEHPPPFNGDGNRPEEKRSRHDATLINPGPPALYQLNTERQYIDGTEKKVRRWTYGRRDKQNKVILMVGGTGAGKTTIINTMINYSLGVKFEDQEFYQITEETEKHFQTSAVTVYEVFVEENSTSLTIIDTPGYGNTEGYEKDREISEYLSRLFSDEDGIHYIDAVCFVMEASENRISERELYIFHSVQSLFGRDIENNIVFLLTHADGQRPKDATIKKAEIPCRRDEDNEPVHFLFNNQQKEKREEQNEHMYRSAWEMGDESMNGFFTLLEEKNRKSVQMTLDVLKERKQLEACVSNLKDRISENELKTIELTVFQEVIKEHRDMIEKCENLKFNVEKTVKNKVLIENTSWKNKNATCCSVCKENCHENCWWVKDLSWCEVMKNNHCTVCEKKCHYSIHIRENKKYETETWEVEMTFNELKQEYEHTGDRPETSFDKKKYENNKKEHERCMKNCADKTKKEVKLKSDLEEIKKQKSILLREVYVTIMSLSNIALKSDSAFTLQHLDFLIDLLKEEGEDEWMKNLDDLRKTGEEQKNNGDLRHLLKFTMASLSDLQRSNSMDLPPEMISDATRLRDEFIELYERNYPQLQECIERLCHILKTFEEYYRSATKGSRDAGVAGIVGGTFVATGIVGFALAPVTLGASLIAAASVASVQGVLMLVDAENESKKCRSEKQRQMMQLRQDIEGEMEKFQDKINPMAEKMTDIHECTDIILRFIKKRNQQVRHLREYFDSVSKKHIRQLEELAELTKQMSETTRLIATIAAIYGGFSLVLDMFSVIENSRALNDMDKLAKKTHRWRNR
ncbi:uncharacterized protein si:dkey-201l21.4 isoform X2 [Megalobrama amblycephala]|uniref:uncharacterized protein si:dkey-201l21.4 isoform X2 n=1 Tax=Megalobrama amblycephala TaxID=75352 RepID=UPI002013E82E|nr:uncharacterized protein si:dkey-201l21.4 isoform X2 [Megalobrama amblycephala]